MLAHTDVTRGARRRVYVWLRTAGAALIWSVRGISRGEDRSKMRGEVRNVRGEVRNVSVSVHLRMDRRMKRSGKVDAGRSPFLRSAKEALTSRRRCTMSIERVHIVEVYMISCLCDAEIEDCTRQKTPDI